MINEFFSHPRGFRAPALQDGASDSVMGLFENCISNNLTDEICDTIRYWHRLLVDYSSSPQDVILPIRIYENLGHGHTRRRALTILENHFAYAFASNSFARAVEAMVLAGIRPSQEEFASIFRNFTACLGFHWGNETVEEQHIAAYPNAYKRKFYLDGWYLAHIHGIGTEVFAGHEDVVVGEVFPVGELVDWQNGNINGINIPIRRIQGELNQHQWEFARAHFLRFLDPINYFLVPSQKREMHVPKTVNCLGEERCVVDFMKRYMSEQFHDEYVEFCDKALIGGDDIPRTTRNELGGVPLHCEFHSSASHLEVGGETQIHRYTDAYRRRTYDILVGHQVVEENLQMRSAALRTIQHFVEATPTITFEELRTAFPKRVNRYHETVILADDDHDPRRYLGPINLPDGRRVFVCGEWIGNGPRMNWHLFVAAAAAVGIDIIEHRQLINQQGLY